MFKLKYVYTISELHNLVTYLDRKYKSEGGATALCDVVKKYNEQYGETDLEIQFAMTVVQKFELINKLLTDDNIAELK